MKKRFNKGAWAAKADKKKLGSIPDFAENELFTKIYEELRELCNFIEKKPECLSDKDWDDKAQAISNYVLIRLVNVLENQLKTITTELIDGFEIHPADVLRENEISFSIYDLDVFRQASTTNGKLVTQQYQFANVRKIGDIFSRINNLNFFPWLEEVCGGPIENEFQNIILMRNDVVHNLHDVEWSPSELKKKVGHIQAFANIFFIISWLNLDKRQKFAKKLESICKDKLNKNLAEFRKITKNHQIKN